MVALIPKILGAIVETMPEALELIEKWVHHEKAKRVEQVRPERGYAQAAADELKGRDPVP